MGVLNSLIGDLGEFNMASASMCDVLAAASGSTTAAHRVFQVSGSATEAERSVTAPHVYDDDDFINYIASNGLPDVKCGIGKCVQMNKARSLVCRSHACGKFLGPVWWCVKCNLPSLESENKCRQWMCAGVKTSVTKKPSDKAYADCLTNFHTRLGEARAETLAHCGGSSGGGGGTGGTGGHGAANE
jgi:hypothetical protein